MHAHSRLWSFHKGSECPRPSRLTGLPEAFPRTHWHPSFQLRNNINVHGKKNIVFTKGTPRKLRKLNGSLLSLLTGGAGNHNYWHWLFDVLPRFGICNKSINLNKIDYFLLPSLLKDFQRETLDCLNIPENKRISSEKFRHIKTKELIITDHPVMITGNATKDHQNTPNWISSWLRDNFLDKNKVKDKNKKNRIYIDRSETNSNKAPQRTIINEEEIKKYLIKNNFIIVKLHETKFKMQVDLFQNAECIVGLHGAGFGNVVFCETKTKIIEGQKIGVDLSIDNSFVMKIPVDSKIHVKSEGILGEKYISIEPGKDTQHSLLAGDIVEGIREVDFSEIKNSNHFFKDREEDLKKVIDKYIQKKTELI